jgi:hypothetical protein
MTRISKDLIWLQPFIKSVRSLVPLKKVRRFFAYKLPLDKRELAVAWCTNNNDGTYTISFSTHDRVVKRVGNCFEYTGYARRCRAEILDTLAHELAHLKYFDHDIRHYRLQLQIMWRFARVMERKGVKDTWSRKKIR